MTNMKASVKIAAVATGLAMATSMLSLAPIAHAASLTTAQVSSILGLLSSFGADSATVANVNAALTGGTPSTTTTTTTTGTSACTFSADLTIGSSGMAVTCLQNALIAGGFSIPAGATGYFGTQTRAAVASWQSSKNIAPAVGYFGALSRAAFNLGGSTGTTTTTTGTVNCPAGYTCTSTTGTVTSGPLTGTGRLTSVSSLGDITSDLEEGDSATAVIGVSADATDGDVAVQRVDVTFDMTGVSGGSTNLNQYVSDVSLYLGSTKLASMDPALGDKSSSIWTYRFSGLNGVIKQGTSGNLYVKVTPLTSIGTLEDGDTITAGLAVDSVRAVGSDGISDTYISTAVTQAFTVSSATTGTLTVTAASDNPTTSQVAVSSSTTTGVNLLSFNMKAKNTDVVITDLVASFGTSDDNLNDVVNTVYLMKGSTVLKTKTLSTGTYGTVTFADINRTIAKDTTENYSLVVDLKGDSAYADGVTLVASTTVAGWDVTDVNGAAVTPSAAAVGNTQTLTATGISVTRGTPTQSVSNGLTTAGDIATFTIPFTVTAGDTAVYIAGSATKTSTNTAAKVTFSTTTSSTSGATGEPTANISVADVVSGDSAGVYYKVNANTSRTFTLNAAITATTTGATTAGYVGIVMNNIAYGTVAGTEATYYTSNLDTFKTNDVYVTKR